MKKLRLWAAASLAAVSAAACSTYEAEDRYRRADDVVMGSPPPRAANEARRVLDYRYEGGAYDQS